MVHVTRAVKKTPPPPYFLQDFTILSAKLTVLTPVKGHLTFGSTWAFLCALLQSNLIHSLLAELALISG